MLRGLRLENFKALKDTGQLELRPITLLMGPNSSGKSSVLQALLAGRATARERPDAAALVLSEGEDLDLGTFTEVARQGVRPSNFTLTYTFETEVPPVRLRTLAVVSGKNGVKLTGSVRACFRYLTKSRETYVHLIEIHVEIPAHGLGIDITGSNTTAGTQKFRWTLNSPSTADLFSTGDSHTRELRKPERSFFALPSIYDLWPELNKDRRIRPEAERLRRLYDLATYGVRKLQQDLGTIRHVGAMREEPARSYALRGSRPTEVGRRGQRAPEIIFAETRRKKSRDKLMAGLDRALMEMGISTSIIPRIPSGASAFSLLVNHIKPRVKVNIASVGFGVSQILPILVEVFHSPPNALVMLEQPEIHLHPRAQSRVADLLAGAATSGGANRRFLVETHSEHLVRRLQVLIADPTSPLRADDVRVYYFVPREDGTDVVALPLDEEGRFIGEWPDGFFDEQLVLTEQHLEAVGKQKVSQ